MLISRGHIGTNGRLLTRKRTHTHVWCVTHPPQITHTSLAGIGCVTRYSLLDVNSNTQCGCSSNTRHRRLHAPTAPAHLRKISVPRRLGAWAQSQSAQKRTAKQGHHHSCEFLIARIYVYIYALVNSTGVRVVIFFCGTMQLKLYHEPWKEGGLPWATGSLSSNEFATREGADIKVACVCMLGCVWGGRVVWNTFCVHM